MASCSSLLSEEQFLCSICLDVFTQPISTPCGHNFCMSCIKEYWDDNDICQCPLCLETFAKRPALKVNTFISELASQFKSLQMTSTQMQRLVQQQQPGSSSTVLCDICTGAQEAAVKSCLECLSSYCDVHLEPHFRAAGLKRHMLVEPVARLEDQICKDHNRLLASFCKSDAMLLCDICSSLSHSNHNIVSIQQAYEEAMDQLEEGELAVQRVIKRNTQEVRAMKECVEKSKTEAKDVIAVGVQELDELVSGILESKAELVKGIEERQKKAEEQAEGFISSAEKEIRDLQSTVTKLRGLKQTEDQLYFLQNIPKMKFKSHGKNSLALSFDRYVDFYHIRRCLSKTVPQLQKLLTEMNSELKQFVSREELSNTFLKYMRQYVHDIVLDPDTAHPLLVVSDDQKQVRFEVGLERDWQNQNPNMFTAHLAVLGTTAFSTYKFYFEVFVGGKTEWCLGMVKESIQRHGEIPRRPGCGLWAIWFIEDKFETFCHPNVTVHCGKVERVGVFVRYETDQILFYDVQNLQEIYSFTKCGFTEKLYPYLNPCDYEYDSNFDPMIIVPVQRTEHL